MGANGPFLTRLGRVPERRKAPPLTRLGRVPERRKAPHG